MNVTQISTKGNNVKDMMPISGEYTEGGLRKIKVVDRDSKEETIAAWDAKIGKWVLPKIRKEKAKVVPISKARKKGS